MPLAIFPAHVSKILRLPRKSDTNSYEVLHLSRKIISANLKIWCSKMQPLSGNQRPDLRTALMNKSLVLRLPRERHLARSMSQACHRFRTCYKTITFCSLLTRCIIPCACHAKRHLNVQKCSEPLVFFTFLTSKCASCRNDVHFFDITTSKTWCVLCILTWKFASRHNDVHFFRHHNFQKWSEHGALHILTWKRASPPQRRAIFHLSTASAALASLLFDPPEPQIIGKTQCFAIFLPFRAPGSLFWSSFFFSSLLWVFPSLLFICPYCRKFDF